MKVVKFYTTRSDGSGQDVACSITLADDGSLTFAGERQYVQLLFDRGQQAAGREAMEEAMRQAPYRFSGTYLRAGFEEVADGGQ